MCCVVSLHLDEVVSCNRRRRWVLWATTPVRDEEPSAQRGTTWPDGKRKRELFVMKGSATGRIGLQGRCVNGEAACLAAVPVRAV